jgi:TctA family transporter
MEALAAAFGLVLQADVLTAVALAAVFGLFVGAIPGLTATMAVALLVPVTIFMEPVPAVAVVVTVVATAIFAGDIPGALLRIPGTPASAAYTDDAFAMSRAGDAELALGVSLVYSVLGGLVGAVVLTAAAPLLAEFALQFSSFEYFWLASLGLTCAVFMSAESRVKAIGSLLLGLLVSTVGLDVVSGQARFTFGRTELLGGINFIPVLIGLFAVSEVIRHMAASTPDLRVPARRIGNIFAGVAAVGRRHWRSVIRGNALGVGIGILPGAGGDIAAWIAYAVSKRCSRHPELYGQGHVEGIVESASANNSALASAWIPTLVFGIPGDSTTAIIIGVLYMQGLNPGPTVFLERPELVYAVFLTFFLANLVMLPLGLAAIKSATLLLRVPRDLLMPIILACCIVGAFAINNAAFGIVVMLVFGLVGFLMEENGFPLTPAILGMVLGRMVEEQFMISMIKAEGNVLAFVDRPIAGLLALLALTVWAWPAVQIVRARVAGLRPVG